MTPVPRPPVGARPLEDYFTVPEAAAACQRSVKTIRNLVSKHQLPRKLRWRVYRRRRLRIMWLSPETVWQLQQLTIDAPE